MFFYRNFLKIHLDLTQALRSFLNPPNLVSSPSSSIDSYPTRTATMEQDFQQLHQNVISLFHEICPQQTPNGFPSQYTSQTFNNNLIEQSIALNNAAKNIDYYVVEIDKNIHDIKSKAVSHTNNYLLQQHQRIQTGALADGDGEAEVDAEERKLLGEILLLTKEVQNGTQLIYQQRERLLLIDSMLKDVNRENAEVQEAIYK